MRQLQQWRGVSMAGQELEHVGAKQDKIFFKKN